MDHRVRATRGGGDHQLRGVAAHPLRTAILFGLGYAIVCSLYIQISGRLAEGASLGKEELARLEQIKGMVFVLTMSVLVFAATWILLRRSARDATTILEQEQTIARASRRAMVGAFAASVAHDIRNVVMIATLELDKIARRPDLAEATKEAVAHLEDVVHRIRDLSWRLLLLGRESLPGQPEPIDLTPTIRDGLDLARSHLKVAQCDVSVDVEESVILNGNHSAIQEMILNLVINAADATGGQGRIEVRAFAEDERRVIEVHDDGPGIPESEREDVFRAFYTSKGDGTGLGLLSVRACAEVHGGAVEIDDSPLGGACFRVVLRSAS